MRTITGKSYIGTKIPTAPSMESKDKKNKCQETTIKKWRASILRNYQYNFGELMI